MYSIYCISTKNILTCVFPIRFASSADKTIGIEKPKIETKIQESRKNDKCNFN